MFRSKGLALVAMLVLLLGTASPALARMTCVMGGPSVLSLGQAEECAPTDHAHEATTVQATCCEVLQTQPQHAAFIPAGGVLLPLLSAAVLPMVAPSVEAPGPVRLSVVRTSRPPPLTCERRLAVIGTYLI